MDNNGNTLSYIRANFKKSADKIFKIIENDKFLILLPIFTVAIRVIVFFIVTYTYEDAYITFRYAENLANGFGLVYNVGERVYGTTTPLFAIILSFFKFIGISCIVSSLILNLIAECITTLIVYKFLKEYSNTIVASIVSVLIVLSPSNISWSVQGMETAFFSAIIALSFFSYIKISTSVRCSLDF
jgi:4-amino-4-deoxy-L-arabinose transferase-like glycosyltransferase